MRYTSFLTYLSWIITYFCSSCSAAPATDLSKRGPIYCLPIHFNQPFVYEDCLRARSRMLREVRNPYEVVSFGSGPDVGVSVGFGGHPLSWEHGTCLQ